MNIFTLVPLPIYQGELMYPRLTEDMADSLCVLTINLIFRQQ